MPVLTGLIWRLAGMISLGAILVVPSELWFYPVDLTAGFVTAILVYGAFGWAMISALSVAGRLDRNGWWIGAGIFGFLAEGIVVAELYATLPFSILWTSLAWHGVVTVGLCLLALRAAMARSGLATFTLSAAIGLGLGIWNGWMWSVVEHTDGTQSFVWQPPGAFSAQMIIGWLLFAAGHWAWDRSQRRLPALDLRADCLVLGICALLVWAVGWALPLFPASLVLPLLLLMSGLALRGGTKRDSATPPRILPPRILITAALPVAAIGVFALIQDRQIGWEVNAFAAILLGIPAAWLWGRAMVAGLLHGAAKSAPGKARQTRAYDPEAD